MTLPANWKTTFSGIGAALFSLLTILAALPETLGPVADTLPPEWKPFLVKAGIAGMVGLKVVNSIVQKDANPSPPPAQPPKPQTVLKS